MQAAISSINCTTCIHIVTGHMVKRGSDSVVNISYRISLVRIEAIDLQKVSHPVNSIERELTAVEQRIQREQISSYGVLSGRGRRHQMEAELGADP